MAPLESLKFFSSLNWSYGSSQGLHLANKKHDPCCCISGKKCEREQTNWKAVVTHPPEVFTQVAVRPTFQTTAAKMTRGWKIPRQNSCSFYYPSLTLWPWEQTQSADIRSSGWFCLSSFAAIPAVHHCHQLLIDQRLMRLMFTAARLSLPPITLQSDARRTRLHSTVIFESEFQ